MIEAPFGLILVTAWCCWATWKMLRRPSRLGSGL